MAKNINLTGKTTVVTGAGSGIGASTARLLARHGAKVHVADINADAAARPARSACGLRGDVRLAYAQKGLR